MIYALALAAQLMLCQDTASLSGRVTDAVTHLPIAGAVVDLTLPLKGNFFQGTDSDGVYRFESLPSGEAFVVVGRNGYVNLGGVVPADRVTIEVTGKSTRDFALLSGGKIFGRIVDADTRKPINDLAVIPRFIDPDPGAPGFGAMPEGVSPAVPNAAGEFALWASSRGRTSSRSARFRSPKSFCPNSCPNSVKRR